MAEFVAFDASVEISGSAAMSMLDGLGPQSTPVLEEYGLAEINPAGWYPQQRFLDALKEIATRGYFNLVSVGMQIPDKAQFPSDIQTVEDALRLLDVAYHMNHRNGEIGEYRYEKLGERKAKMVCRNPYPSDFDYGLIYRIVKKYRPADSRTLSVRRLDDEPNRRTGADSCTYLIEW